MEIFWSLLKVICESRLNNMKTLIIFLLIVLLVVAGGVFVYLYSENEKPIRTTVSDDALKVDGLVPFEQWQEQNKSDYNKK